MEADMRDRRRPDLEPGRGPSFRLTPQVVFGAIVMLFGVVLLADNLGYPEARGVLRLWPLGLVAIGLVKVLSPSQGQSGRVFGGLLALAGAALSAEHIFGMPIDFEEWWPLVLIGFGVLILSRAFRKGRLTPDGSGSRESYFSEFATWAGKKRRVTAPGFRGADLTAVMGGIEIDLRGAGTHNGDAVIDVFVMWGGIEIWVPPDWAVVNEVTALMGGVDDSSGGAKGAEHRLTIRGLVVMGGLDIKT